MGYGGHYVGHSRDENGLNREILVVAVGD